MKKYKIGNRLITADSVVKAIKLSKILDEQQSEIDYLTKEEEQAVEDYRKAIAGTTNPKLLKVYAHILKEETEHIQELQEADVEDCDMKDFAPEYAIWVKKNGKWLIFGGATSTNIDKRRFLNSGYEDVIVTKNGEEPINDSCKTKDFAKWSLKPETNLTALSNAIKDRDVTSLNTLLTIVNKDIDDINAYKGQLSPANLDNLKTFAALVRQMNRIGVTTHTLTI